MILLKRTKVRPIPSQVYTRDYYLNPLGGLQGASEFGDFIKKGTLYRIPKQAVSFAAVKKNAVILDVGCGRGELVCHFGKRGHEVVGIDYSAAAIKICNGVKVSLPAKARKMVSFLRADATILPFPGNYFDCVFFNDVIEHQTPSQAEKSLREIYRVLKPNGMVIIHTNNYWFEKVGYWLIALSYHGPGILLQERHDVAEEIHINYVSKNSLAKALKTAGFSARITVTVPHTFHEMKTYLPYDNSAKAYLLHHFGFLLLKSPLKYFLGPTLWALGTKM